MHEPRYRGESWAHSILRADLEAAEADLRAQQRQAEDEAARAAAARTRRLVAEAEIAPAPPNPAPRSATPKRRTWRDLSPDELNRYALAESRQP